MPSALTRCDPADPTPLGDSPRSEVRMMTIEAQVDSLKSALGEELGVS